jgi:hypothetical protein
MDYELIENQFGSTVKATDNDGKVFWIPIDPANADYQEFLAQLEAEKN